MATAGDRHESVTGNIWSYSFRNDLTGVKAALMRNPDCLNLCNTVGWTPLHAACAGGSTKVVQFLLSKNVDTSIVDHSGLQAVHQAAKNGRDHVLRTLQAAGVDLSIVRLSQCKGKAVRSIIQASYKDSVVGEEPEAPQEAVGYARKQPRSTAFWGPRKTPISGKIKKNILKQRRQRTMEKKQAKNRESSEDLDCNDAGPQTVHLWPYQDTVQAVKRDRKNKLRARQAPKNSHPRLQQPTNETTSDSDSDDVAAPMHDFEALYLDSDED